MSTYQSRREALDAALRWAALRELHTTKVQVLDAAESFDEWLCGDDGELRLTVGPFESRSAKPAAFTFSPPDTDSTEVDKLRDERDQWIGEAKRWESLYRTRDKDASRWFRRMRDAKAKLDEAAR